MILIDVGASGGPKDIWKSIKPYIKFIGFEPDDRGLEGINEENDDGSVYFNSGLYKESGLQKLYLTKHQDASSILIPNKFFLNKFYEPRGYDILKSIDIKVDKLDSILNKKNIFADFLKIDTQGFEKSVLDGAENSLSRISGIQIEMSLSTLYEGELLYMDMIRHL